jgi:exopolysaccharide biosynthesis polyprenyl glycosylphosphotransferase
MHKYILLVVDVVVLGCAFVVSLLIKFNTVFQAALNQWTTLLFLIICVPVVFHFFDLYNRLFYTQHLRIFFRMLKALLTIFLIYIILGFLTKFYFLIESRVFIFLFFAVTAILFFAIRLVLARRIMESFYCSQTRRIPCAYMGPDSRFEDIERFFDLNRITGYRIVKKASDSKNRQINDVFLLCESNRFDELYLYIKKALSEKRRVHVTSELLSMLNLGWEWCRIDHMPVYTFHQKKNQRVRDFIRRALDVIGSIVGLVVLAPFFVIIAIAIKLDSHGPVIFKQTRCGKNGEKFTFYKFRSMKEHEKSAAERSAEVDYFRTHGVPKIETMNSDFITEVGKILRKTSMDEWPQFVNVLKGEMSLVGPRPQQPHEIRCYATWHKDRLTVKQGLTGLWQVYGRGELPSDKSVFLDLIYVVNRTLTLDIKLLFQTIPAVILGRGAY